MDAAEWQQAKKTILAGEPTGSPYNVVDLCFVWADEEGHHAGTDKVSTLSMIAL